MTFEHTSILDRRVFLRIKPVRYYCEHCDDGTTTTEKYDWVAKGGKITQALEDYIMRQLIHSTIQDVSRKTGLSYSTIYSAMTHRIGVF
jgi:transposase